MAVTWARKTDTLTVRVDPRTRFGLDLLASVTRRSVSDLVLEEIRAMLERELPKRSVGGKRISILDAVWDVFAQDRMVKLALHAPELLSDEEQKVWRVIAEDRAYLPKRTEPDFAAIRRDWNIIQQRVREYEESFGRQ
jgi:hypothetical protein